MGKGIDRHVAKYLAENPKSSVADIAMGTGFLIGNVHATVMRMLGRGYISTDGMKKDIMLGDKVHTFRVPNDNGKHF